LEELGISLIFFHGEMEDFLELMEEQGLKAAAIHSHQETGTQVSYQRDQRIHSYLQAKGISWKEYPHGGVIRPLKNRDRRDRIVKQRHHSPILPVPSALPIKKYTRLARDTWPQSLHNWQDKQRLICLEALDLIPLDPTRVNYAQELHQSMQSWSKRLDISPVLQFLIPRISPPPLTTELFPQPLPSPRQGCSREIFQEDLNSFLDYRSEGYSGGMSSMNSAPSHCSRLSVHLAWGTASIREALQEAEKEAAKGERAKARNLRSFIKRLFWHDHFVQRLEDEPRMEQFPLNPCYQDFPLPPNLSERFWAWIDGRTGYPYVDAGIRCLRSTGYLNFRSRALIVSFAVHSLRLPWELILYPMAQMMADYVPGIHISQLQMQAGVVGINTLRVYSPTKQLEDHDPNCRYVKSWLPELAGYSPQEILGGPLFSLAPYPEPIVDYKKESKIFKDYYFLIKKDPKTREEARKVYERHGSRRRN
jgi:deoxyribodipyrimidine photo-lyase